MSSFNGYASILGSAEISSYTLQIGEGTTFTNRVFISDQNGVGKQTENYIVYSPNESITPLITFNNELFGTSKISKEVERLKGEGINLAGGINADFFSLQTGVPMSNLIVDGKIVTKDASGQDSIGILEDGTAFMSYVTFASVLIKEDGSETNIYNINKFRQPYSIYMMTDEFSKQTENTTDGIDVILGEIEGEMRLGTKLTAVVESVMENSSSIEIPKGKIVLTVDKEAPEEFLEPIKTLTEGEKVTISFGVMGDPKWNDVKLGMGCVGGKLLTNGEVNPNLEAGAAPRTAIGLKADGSLVLYTIDGRQTGYSYGVQKKTLAERLKELGCIEALNLDGGGSTCIVSLFPGESTPTLKNKPSDGVERKISTFFFLQNNLSPTKKLGGLTIYPLSAYLLKGAEINLSVKARDTAFFPMTTPPQTELSVVTSGAKSTIDKNGVFHAKDDHVVKIKAEYNDISTFMNIFCLETPTDIKVTDKKGNSVSSLTLSPEEEIQLFATAYGGYNEFIPAEDSFKWSVKGNIGSISKDGVFVAVKNKNEKGEISVTVGEKTVAIPVNVIFTPDPDEKESYPVLEITEEDNTLKGEISSPLGILVDKDGITLTADGMEMDFDFDYDSQTFETLIPSGVEKINIIVTNPFGLSTFKSVYKGEESEENIFMDAEGHWAEKELNYMYKRGIVNGEKNGDKLIYRPQKEMTRAEFSVMMCNYLKLDTSLYENAELPFEDKDVIPNWAVPSVKALFEDKIITGKTYPDGKVHADPQSSISRAEAATIIARTIKNKYFKESFSYSDMDDIPSWAKDGTILLMSLKAMNGYPDGTVKPENFLTKAEAAKLLYSIL